MPRIPISDLDDPRVAHYRHLKPTNRTRRSGVFVVEGETLVDRLLASEFPTVSVLSTERFERRIAPKVPEDIPLLVVPDDRIEDLIGYHFHRGVLACGGARDWPDLDSILQARGPRATLVICPTLDKPDNLGSILRIGDAFGVDAVVVGKACPEALSRRVIRVSMGAAFRLPVFVEDDLPSLVDRLRRDHGLGLIAADAHPDAEPLDRASRPDRLGIVLGSEATGLDDTWLARVDRRVTIPMRPGADSLNVAVAAGIFLHHYTRSDLG
ncbi:TrmH family RNA methyltransferase [Tundrisphaera lichenicola]|uniref:TrmH family RNA methyltransferase n=1 Tax=Tundrisphaera lichenicola TaxID=2029860 RepID=UPI003EC131F0